MRNLQHKPSGELHHPRRIPTWRTRAQTNPAGKGSYQAVPAGRKTVTPMHGTLQLSQSVYVSVTPYFGRSRKAAQASVLARILKNKLRKKFDTLRLTLFSFVSVFSRTKGEERCWGVLELKAIHSCITWTRTNEHTDIYTHQFTVATGTFSTTRLQIISNVCFIELNTVIFALNLMKFKDFIWVALMDIWVRSYGVGASPLWCFVCVCMIVQQRK